MRSECRRERAECAAHTFTMMYVRSWIDMAAMGVGWGRWKKMKRWRKRKRTTDVLYISLRSVPHLLIAAKSGARVQSAEPLPLHPNRAKHCSGGVADSVGHRRPAAHAHRLR